MGMVLPYFLYATYFFIEKPKKLSKIIGYLLFISLGGVVINVITTKAYLRTEVNSPIAALSAIIISYTIASFLVNLFQEIKKSIDEKTKFQSYVQLFHSVLLALITLTSLIVGLVWSIKQLI